MIHFSCFLQAWLTVSNLVKLQRSEVLIGTQKYDGLLVSSSIINGSRRTVQSSNGESKSLRDTQRLRVWPLKAWCKVAAGKLTNAELKSTDSLVCRQFTCETVKLWWSGRLESRAHDLQRNSKFYLLDFGACGFDFLVLEWLGSCQRCFDLTMLIVLVSSGLSGRSYEAGAKTFSIALLCRPKSNR